jgi:hypothetical protein
MNEIFDDFENKIIAALKGFLIEVEQNNYKGNTIWTKRIKEVIGDLGMSQDFNCKVAAAGFEEKFEPEWLYDLVWYSEDANQRLTKLKLIVECEWETKYLSIKYDFEKLLVGKAEKFLFICQSKMQDIESLFEKLKTQIDVFENNKGDRYLIAILDCNTDRNFYFKSYTKK